MHKMTPKMWKFADYLKLLVLGLIIAAVWGPPPIWGQPAQRIPLELKVKLADGKIKIGQTFVDSLEDRIKRSDTFRLSDSALPRLVLRVFSEDLPDNIFQSVIAVTRTAAVPWKGGSREIFLDNLLMVGVSAAHSGRDAQDVLEDTQRRILPRFAAISREVK